MFCIKSEDYTNSGSNQNTKQIFTRCIRCCDMLIQYIFFVRILVGKRMLRSNSMFKTVLSYFLNIC